MLKQPGLHFNQMNPLPGQPVLEVQQYVAQFVAVAYTAPDAAQPGHQCTAEAVVEDEAEIEALPPEGPDACKERAEIVIALGTVIGDQFVH